jgi:hypothetical protein
MTDHDRKRRLRWFIAPETYEEPEEEPEAPAE